MLSGITIIATSHPYYGRMAYNLALSIKAVEDISVAMFYRSPAIDHLTDDQRSIFDYLIKLPEQFREGYCTKLHLDELTPFDKTLYLDADMLWLPFKKPSSLFEELQGIQYTGITEGKTGDVNMGYYFWADEAEIREVYKVESVYQWRSEVIYFERGTKVFETARSLNPQLKSIKRFGGSIPDELYFNISTALNDVHPHKYRWTPAYWPRLHKDIIPPDLRQYHLLSFGSNFASKAMKDKYRQVVAASAQKLGVRPMFELHSKRSFMVERQKM
jgi:hypothetical protein